MKDHSIKKTLVLGSGALKIGEAGEFDYSGSQALKALKEEGVETVLLNPNIATIQTSTSIADKVYLLPILPHFVEQIIIKEKPDSILLSFGGQTALNCGVQLYQQGILKKYNVRVLGSSVDAIIQTEDREVFKQTLSSIGVKTARSQAVSTLDEGVRAVQEIGFPVIIRSAFALGGLGSGFANNMEEFVALAEKALALSPQILVEESLKGWKEIEYEVLRDADANCITVCNMENFDPIGIHTGESIVVAPSQTLSNSEFHQLRKLSIKIIQHFGIVGECNVQFALDPKSEDYRVIEVNARLSRSSALASKATGYPLAYISAKVALGYRLHELKNNTTQKTSAFFEPALDYCVVKIPRWDLGKFQGVDREIGSSMKSVGEIMSIGRSFEEAIQKGIRMLDIGMNGFIGNAKNISFPNLPIEELLSRPTDNRILLVAHALQHNYSLDEIHQITGIDIWFLSRLQNIYNYYQYLEDRIKNVDSFLPQEIIEAKKMGFSDTQLALLFAKDDHELDEATEAVRQKRIHLGINPYIKQIDTLAGEFPAQTNYLYMTYHGSSHDVKAITEKSVVVLGSGCYRIGSSVEFDWCCVNTAEAIRNQQTASIIINCNPETVSTDYDVSDRLFFEELSLERVRDIVDFEQPSGVIVSVGGQTSNNLAMQLKKHQVKILGTDAKQIDKAENRHLFSQALDKLLIQQPEWREFSSLPDIYKFVDEIGFPLLIRPSYVLSGAAMSVVSNKEELVAFLHIAKQVSKKYPIVVSQFIEGAKEIEIDGVASDGNLIAYEISEHVENAGVHSGDATLRFPCQTINQDAQIEIANIAKALSKEFEITGPFNIQFLYKHEKIKVIELNLRASRSFPFISKISGRNLIYLATLAQLGEKLKPLAPCKIEHVGIKSPQFSFTRLKGADPVLGVEMASTGEVGCIASNSKIALLQSMISVGYSIPKKNILISAGPPHAKEEIRHTAQRLVEKGYQLFATQGTYDFFVKCNIPASFLYWPNDKNAHPTTIDTIRDRKIDLVINIPKNFSKGELDNDYTTRRFAIDMGIPLLTNTQLTIAFVESFLELKMEDIEIKSLADFIKYK